MHFLQLIQHELCHPDAVILQAGPKLHCNFCQKDPICNIYQYIQQPFENHFDSSLLAQSYCEWTGDYQVPMTFTLIDIDGILPKRVQGQTLSRIYECIQLLRAINAPFTSDPSSVQKPWKEMNTFFQKYLDAVTTHSTKEVPSNAERLLNQLMESMHQIIQSKEFANPFEFYFEKLVPYVQNCVSQWTPLPVISEDSNLAKELLIQLQRSSMIRKLFGKYCIPFDIIHVMLGCYGCCSDLEMVSNWVLDLMARICRGDYFWKRYASCQFVQVMNHLISTEITYKKRTNLYHVIREIRCGNAADSLSSFWANYLQLQALIHEKYRIPKIPSNILQMAENQLFPAILFEKHSDQLGFTLALGHLLVSADLKRGEFQKGAFKKSRQIHQIISRCIEKIKNFDSIRTYWTLETLKMFLVSEPKLEDEIKEVMQLAFMKKE